MEVCMGSLSCWKVNLEPRLNPLPEKTMFLPQKSWYFLVTFHKSLLNSSHKVAPASFTLNAIGLIIIGLLMNKFCANFTLIKHQETKAKIKPCTWLVLFISSGIVLKIRKICKLICTKLHLTDAVYSMVLKLLLLAPNLDNGSLKWLRCHVRFNKQRVHLRKNEF